MLCSSEISCDSFQIIEWRGAKWKLFIRKSIQAPTSVDVYVAIHKPEEVKKGWACGLHFTFTLLTASGRRSKYARGNYE